MIFHLIIDTPFYTDELVKKANLYSNEKNIFILINKSKSDKIHYIKNRNFFQTDLKGAIRKFQEEEKDVNKIMIHFLSLSAIIFLNKISPRIPVYWMFWGADGYNHPKLKKNIYLTKTQSTLNRINPRSGIKKILDNYRSINFKNKMERSLKKIDFCCTQIKGDYDLIMDAVPKLKMKHKHFAYRGIDYKNEYILSYKKGYIKQKILLGNSANPTNNHLDALMALKNYSNHIETIICPLSYSGSSKYVKEVMNYGKKNFGNRFIPLTEFLPLNKYEELIKSIDIAIFYHTRQQGFSNTVLLFENNKKILMHSNSTLYKMYKDFGVENVYSNFDDLFCASLKANPKLNHFLNQNVIDEWYKDVLNN